MTDEAVFAAVAAVLESGGDADDVLRDVVGVLVSSGACAWAGILFAEDGELVLGPEAGAQMPSRRMQLPVEFNGTRVAELIVDDGTDAALVARVAASIGEWCLVGWDTGGVPWESLE